MVFHSLLIFNGLSLRNDYINDRYLDCIILFLDFNLLLNSYFYMRRRPHFIYLLFTSDLTLKVGLVIDTR